MTEKILLLNEVKKIAKEFIRMEWNADVTEYKSVLLSNDKSLYEVDGRAGIHQQDMQTAPPASLDTIIEFNFKLQISTKDGQVRGFQQEHSRASGDFSSDKQRDRNLKDAQEARERAEAEYYEEKAEYLRDKKNKDESDPFKELGKKYGFDEKKFRL